MKQEPLPQIYHVKDTDIPRFAYMLHVLAGDFLRESEFNMRTLATEVQPDTIAIMGKNHMWLHDALAAYRTTADLHQIRYMEMAGIIHARIIMIRIRDIRHMCTHLALIPGGKSCC